jgi:hypothetical protein
MVKYTLIYTKGQITVEAKNVIEAKKQAKFYRLGKLLQITCSDDVIGGF